MDTECSNKFLIYKETYDRLNEKGRRASLELKRKHTFARLSKLQLKIDENSKTCNKEKKHNIDDFDPDNCL